MTGGGESEHFQTKTKLENDKEKSEKPERIYHEKIYYTVETTDTNGIENTAIFDTLEADRKK